MTIQPQHYDHLFYKLLLHNGFPAKEASAPIDVWRCAVESATKMLPLNFGSCKWIGPAIDQNIPEKTLIEANYSGVN